MEFLEHIGGIKSEPCLVGTKLNQEPEVVEIGIDDINYSSDEGNGQQPKYIKQEVVIKKIDVESPHNVSIKDEASKQEEKSEIKGRPNDLEEFIQCENLHSGEKLILNYGPVLNRTEKRKNETNAYKTSENTNVSEDLKKVKITRAPHTAVALHEYTVLAKDKYVCNHCQVVITDIKGLRRHIRRLHREIVDIRHCPYCPFTSKWSLRSHILHMHKDTKEIQWFKCHLCSFTSKTKFHLASHALKHLNPEAIIDMLEPCEVCGKLFKKKLLSRHVRFVHNKEKRKRFNCELCHYSTLIHSGLKHHIQYNHTDPNTLKIQNCTECDFTTRYPYLLKRHKTDHDKRYCCEMCGFKSKDPAQMKLHQITHQTNIDEKHLKYQCDKCDYKTYRIYSFKVHKLNHLKPEEIEYFYCYHCKFKAKRKDNLKTHILRHFQKEEVKLYCFLCDFSSKKRDLLNKHIKKHSVKSEVIQSDQLNGTLAKAL